MDEVKIEEKPRKKRILYNSNYSRLFTGFGKNTKNLLTYLAKTNKYEIFEYAGQIQWSHPDLQTLPWQAHGALPDSPQEIQQLNQDPARARNAGYGEVNIEKAVSEFHPDVIFAVEDCWGQNYMTTKNFWSKIPCVFWTTQDSLPLLLTENADKTPHYWNWSEFATDAFHKLGKKHVKTQYPPVDLTNYYNIGSEKKLQLRAKFKIPQDTFVIGDVFRNQLRKLTPVNGMEGYSIFKKDNPGVKSILLLITNYKEGWNITQLAMDYKVDPKEIWTAYISSEANDYILAPYVGNDQVCPFTGKEKAFNTVSVDRGVSEEQLNEIYNVMDVFLHAATSGACELPCVEAGACEKIILTSSYSFGEDIIKLNKASFSLDYSEFREFGSQFIKSNPYPSSIAKQLKKVYQMGQKKRDELGIESRKWAKDNYDLELNCKKIETFIDSLPLADWSTISLTPEPKNPDYPMPVVESEDEFITLLYKNILKMEEGPQGQGRANWIQQLKNGVSREQVFDFFKKTAVEENNKNAKIDFSSLIDQTDKKRGLMVIPQSIGDCIEVTKLFKSFHEKYVNTDLYVATNQQFFEIFESNQYVFRVIPFIPQMKSELLMIQPGTKRGYFDYYLFPTIPTQEILGYLSHI